jgi:hypothetical protein
MYFQKHTKNTRVLENVTEEMQSPKEVSLGASGNLSQKNPSQK